MLLITAQIIQLPVRGGKVFGLLVAWVGIFGFLRMPWRPLNSVIIDLGPTRKLLKTLVLWWQLIGHRVQGTLKPHLSKQHTAIQVPRLPSPLGYQSVTLHKNRLRQLVTRLHDIHPSLIHTGPKSLCRHIGIRCQKANVEF